MQHLVIENVLQKPKRNEGLIESGIDPDHAIFFLDRAEDEIFLGPLFATAAPLHFVTAQPAAKVAMIEFVEDALEIEMSTFMPQVQLPLHGQRQMSRLSLSFFRH